MNKPKLYSALALGLALSLGALFLVPGVEATPPTERPTPSSGGDCDNSVSFTEGKIGECLKSVVRAVF